MSAPPNTKGTRALDIQCDECGAIPGWYCEHEYDPRHLHQSRINAASKVSRDANREARSA